MLSNWGFLLTLSMVCRTYVCRKIFKEPWRPDEGSDYLKFAASGIARVAIRSVNYGFSADVKNPTSAQSTYYSATSQTKPQGSQASSVPSAQKFQPPNPILPPAHPFINNNQRYHHTGTASTTLITSQGQSNYPHLSQGTHLPAATATQTQINHGSQYFSQPTAVQVQAAQGFNQLSHPTFLQQQSIPPPKAAAVSNSHHSWTNIQTTTDNRQPYPNYAITNVNTQTLTNGHSTYPLRPVTSIGNLQYSPNSYISPILNSRPPDGSHPSIVPAAVAANQNFPSQITTVQNGYNPQNIYPIRWSQPLPVSP